MTTQATDGIQYNGLGYSLLSNSPFYPGQIGLHPEPISSACWRGYMASYSVENNQLYLTYLEVGVPLDMGWDDFPLPVETVDFPESQSDKTDEKGASDDNPFLNVEFPPLPDFQSKSDDFDLSFIDEIMAGAQGSDKKTIQTSVYTPKEPKYPELGGKQPEQVSNVLYYREIAHPLDYSGTLLLGRGFDYQYDYVEVDRYLYYRDKLELTFKEGVLIAAKPAL